MEQADLKILCYADDAALIAQNEDNPYKMLFELNQNADKYNISSLILKLSNKFRKKQPLKT